MVTKSSMLVSFYLGQKLVINTRGAQSLLVNWLSGNFFTKLNSGSCTEVTDLTSSGSCFVHNGSNEALGSRCRQSVILVLICTTKKETKSRERECPGHSGPSPISTSRCHSMKNLRLKVCFGRTNIWDLSEKFFHKKNIRFGIKKKSR